MTAAASAAPSLTALAAPFGPAFSARTTTAASAARTAVLAGIVGAHPASVRVSTELLATTEVAASPRSDLGSI